MLEGIRDARRIDHLQATIPIDVEKLLGTNAPTISNATVTKEILFALRPSRDLATEI